MSQGRKAGKHRLLNNVLLLNCMPSSYLSMIYSIRLLWLKIALILVLSALYLYFDMSIWCNFVEFLVLQLSFFMLWFGSAVFCSLKVYLPFHNYTCKSTFSWLRLPASSVISTSISLPGGLQTVYHLRSLRCRFFLAWETVFHELSQRYHLGTEAEASKGEKSQQCICHKKKKECHGDFFLLTWL